MRPDRSQLLSNETRGQVIYFDATGNHDIIVMCAQKSPSRTKSLPDLSLEFVPINTIDLGFYSNAEARSPLIIADSKNSTDTEAPDFTALKKLQIFRPTQNPGGFGEIHEKRLLGGYGRNEIFSST